VIEAMPETATCFECPTCQTKYKVVRVEAPTTHDRQLLCVSCEVRSKVATENSRLGISAFAMGPTRHVVGCPGWFRDASTPDFKGRLSKAASFLCAGGSDVCCLHQADMTGLVGNVRFWGDTVAKVESCTGLHFW
jgi:hypothetical protein